MKMNSFGKMFHKEGREKKAEKKEQYTWQQNVALCLHDMIFMLVIVTAVLMLFLAFVFFGLRVAINCPDRFGSLLACGITLMIGIQAFMNVAVVIGLMPTTGLPLPFFSAGGTSISIFMGAVGILLNISRYSPR